MQGVELVVGVERGSVEEKVRVVTKLIFGKLALINNLLVEYCNGLVVGWLLRCSLRRVFGDCGGEGIESGCVWGSVIVMESRVSESLWT